jgi:hypothetical protein
MASNIGKSSENRTDIIKRKYCHNENDRNNKSLKSRPFYIQNLKRALAERNLVASELELTCSMTGSQLSIFRSNKNRKFHIYVLGL